MSTVSDDFWNGMWISVCVLALLGLIATIVLMVNNGAHRAQLYEGTKFKECVAAKMQWVNENCVKVPVYVPAADQGTTPTS